MMRYRAIEKGCEVSVVVVTGAGQSRNPVFIIADGIFQCGTAQKRSIFDRGSASVSQEFLSIRSCTLAR